MRKRVFFQNAAILTVTSLLLRTIGIFFRIYVSNRVGAEGMGLYQMILSVYVLMSSFATAGLNTAVTRLCTDELACGNTNNAKKLLYACITASVVIGVVSGVGLSIGSEAVAEHILHDTRAVPSLRILTVSLPFMGVSSCIKGYFLARRRVTSSSVAQILEQIVRIVSIVGILEWMGNPDVGGACFAVLLGDTVAEAVSCLYMTLCYWLDIRALNRNDTAAETKRFQRIWHIAAPITAGRYLSSGLRTAENILVPDTLTQYVGIRETALSLFGKLKGMAMPLLFFPSSFLNAFTALLIPEISEAHALGHRNRMQYTIRKTLQVTLLSAMLISGVFVVIATPLCQLVYSDNEVGRMLQILAPLAPIMYLESVVVGLLKGLDQQTPSLIYSIIDSGARILLIVTVLPFYGITGFYAIMIFSNLLTCSLNLHRLCKVSGVRIAVQAWILRPLFAISIAVAVGSLPVVYHLIPQDDLSITCILCGGIVCIVYTVLLFVMRCVNREDLRTIRPMRQKKNDG